MARLRSREAETEDVNPRRLQRGAVKRTHLTRWAVGRDELAPGIVGDIHLDPSVIEVIREHAGNVSGYGMTIALIATADQTIPVGGALLSVDDVDPDFRSSVFDPTLPTSSIVMPLPAVVSVHVKFRWVDWRHGGRVSLLRDGVVVAQSFAGWGTRFEGSLHAGAVQEGESLSVQVDHLDDASHDVTGVRVVPKVEGAPVGVAPPPPVPGENGLYVIGHFGTNLTATRITESTVTPLAAAPVSGIGSIRNIRARIDDGRIRARVWDDGDVEPSTWALDVTDLDPLASGYPGVTGASTSPSGDWRYDTFAVDNDGTPSSTNFSGYTTGAGIPTGWDPVYGITTAGWSIVEDAAYAGGKYLSRIGTAGSYIVWTTAGVGATQEVAVRGWTNRTLGVVLRGQDVR